MGCDRYAAVRCGGGVTPSCAPLTWGSLECCRSAAFLRLKPQGYCRLAAGYEVRGYGVRPLCGRQVWGRRDPKLRSAYLGFSGVLPLRGFFAAKAAGFNPLGTLCHSPYLPRKQRETPARCWRLVSVATRLVMGHWPGVRACCL